MIRKILVRTALGVGAICVLIAVFAGYTIWQAGRGLPQWEGRIELVGLDRPVEILRDKHGIPYVSASSKGDLYFAQGFVHAQDRFWQMSLMRQTSAGRLSEWFGAMTLRSDRRARILGVQQAAERSWAAFPEAERPWLQAYADGVNAWLESSAYRRPPEMVILHVEPEPWRASDVFLAFWQIQEMLAAAGSEFIAAAIRSNAHTQAAIDILDTSDRPVPPIIPASGDTPVIQPSAAFKDRAFSNNWTLSGAHTVTGLPLMANDPQLPATLPGFWQLQHHSAGDLVVAGASVPGIPGIVAGHNRTLAWGQTNAGIDVIDLALVQLRPDHPDQYRRGPGAPWQTFETRREKIAVRFGNDVVETVRITPDGVIWPDDLSPVTYTDLNDVAQERRYHNLDGPITSPAAILRLNEATTVAEAIESGKVFSGPPLNFLLADTQGSIAYFAAGRIPDRPEVHARVVALGPEDGNARTYLPYSENPRIVNPPGGRIVSANQRIIGDEYPHYLTDMWAAPDRALRIHELLDMQQVHDAQSFLRMQMDSLSPPARRIVPLLVGAEPLTESAAELVRILQEWDYRFELETPAPTIFLTWAAMLKRHIIDDELGPNPVMATIGRSFYTPTEQALSGRHAEWCDDRSTDLVETCPQILSESLSEARAALEEAFGPDPAHWAWGNVAKFRLGHLGFAGLPLLDGLFSRTTALPGGPESMFTNGVILLTAPHFSASTVNSSYQGIYDLSDLDASEFMMSGGASGHFKSPYYNNLTAEWIAGKRIRLPSNSEQVERIATLTLVPK